MHALAWCLAAALMVGGPGLGNQTYPGSQLFEPVAFVDSPEGHGNVTMVQGYLMVIYSSDGGGRDTDGGIEFWDLSQPANPVLAASYENEDTHGLREAHGFSLSWHQDRFLLAAQAVEGIQIWDVTDPLDIFLITYLDLPDITRGDYSGDWWTFWQAPALYVAGVGSGIFVVDTTDPAQPELRTRVPTGDIAGVSPAQVFALGNLLVVTEAQTVNLATMDISDPWAPRLLQKISGPPAYSHIFAGPGMIMSSGSVPPRANFFQVTPEGSIQYDKSVGIFLDSGGYGSYQDGFFHSGFSQSYAKFNIAAGTVVGSGSGDRPDKDEDFGTVIGNLAFAGNDHGTGTAIIPHQTSPDTNPPVVEWMHPPENSTGVSPTSRIGLSFSDHIDPASLTGSTLWLEDSMGNAVDAQLSAQLSLVNLFPASPLDINAEYRVVAEGVRDVVGNASPRFEATITTGDGSLSTNPMSAITGVAAAPSLGAYAVGIINPIEVAYSDRDNIFFDDVPPRLQGQPFIRTANNDKASFQDDFLTFEVLVDSEIVVLYDERGDLVPSWLSSFTATGERVTTNDTGFDVYTKTVAAGTVTLGGNLAPIAFGAESMYSVVIIPDFPDLQCELDLTPEEAGTFTLSAPPSDGTQSWLIDGVQYTGPTPVVTLPPGRYGVLLTVSAPPFSVTCSDVQIVHRPRAPEPATTSSRIVWRDSSVFNVNPDNGTVTRVEALNPRVSWTAQLPGRPVALAWAPNGRLWIVDRDVAAVFEIRPMDGTVESSMSLPWGSRPRNIVFSDEGEAFVTLSGTGEVVALDSDGTILRRAFVTPTAHGLTHFDEQLYVTRFISPDDRGEVYIVDAATLEVSSRIDLHYDLGPDTEASGRGVPNYVSEFRVGPGGARAYVASKKDNTARGVYRDALPLTFESRVRTIVSVVDVPGAVEVPGARLDINDRDMIQTTVLSPLGDLLFVASQGTNVVDVFDTNLGQRVTQFETLRAPQGLAIDAAGTRLAVYNFMSRNVSLYNISELLAGTSNNVEVLGYVKTVAADALPPPVLAGKQIFYNAGDPRMSRDSYISCASCHQDGGQDGRVWDFTQAEEGLRNTISLRGRAGTAHGNVHWTANFDEIQDFENDIRNAFGGEGFLSDEDFAATEDPLGPPKAGLSPELDALAAYVSSLTEVPPSPFREADGALTDEARLGRQQFVASGCGNCHAGAAFTDSARHDVGTASTGSGLGIGAPLAGAGFETPTLLGVWHTGPYLHDGSASSLEEAITRHAAPPPAGSPELTQLLAYVAQLDSTSIAASDNCELAGECVRPDEPVRQPRSGCDAAPPNHLLVASLLMLLLMARRRRA